MYYVTYNIEAHPEGLTREAVAGRSADTNQELGACHKIILHSIIEDNGARSTVIASLDGKTGKPLEAIDLFKAWAMMAHQLLEELPEGSWQRAAAYRAFEDVRSRLAFMRNPDDHL